MPYKTITEPYFQSFQYKIINRILNCNEKLHKWGFKTSNQCSYCNEIDTLEHHLFYCRESQNMWIHLKDWVKSNLDVSVNFTVCEILLGIPIVNKSDSLTQILNYLILIAKWYINKCKTALNPVFFVNYLLLVRQKIETVILCNTLNDRESFDWQEELYTLL